MSKLPLVVVDLTALATRHSQAVTQTGCQCEQSLSRAANVAVAATQSYWQRE